MAKTRKIPLRKSVVSGEIIDKRDLLRIVKTKDGEIFIDPFQLFQLFKLFVKVETAGVKVLIPADVKR